MPLPGALAAPGSLAKGQGIAKWLPPLPRGFKNQENPMNNSKLIITVKDPDLGKGWYVVPSTWYGEMATTDEDIVKLVYRDRSVTAVRITREYPIREDALKDKRPKGESSHEKQQH